MRFVSKGMRDIYHHPRLCIGSLVSYILVSIQLYCSSNCTCLACSLFLMRSLRTWRMLWDTLVLIWPLLLNTSKWTLSTAMLGNCCTKSFLNTTDGSKVERCGKEESKTVDRLDRLYMQTLLKGRDTFWECYWITWEVQPHMRIWEQWLASHTLRLEKHARKEASSRQIGHSTTAWLSLPLFRCHVPCEGYSRSF